jgi:hypothetical protein
VPRGAQRWEGPCGRVVDANECAVSDAVDTPEWRAQLLAEPDRRFTLAEALGIADPRADHEPKHHDCVNSNFTIAAIIAEEVGGRPLADELEQRSTLRTNPLGDACVYSTRWYSDVLQVSLAGPGGYRRPRCHVEAA